MSQETVKMSRRFWKLFNGRAWDAWWGMLDEDTPVTFEVRLPAPRRVQSAADNSGGFECGFLVE